MFTTLLHYEINIAHNGNGKDTWSNDAEITAHIRLIAECHLKTGRKAAPSKTKNSESNFSFGRSESLQADDLADQIAVNLQRLYLIYCVICQLRFPGINEELDHSIPEPATFSDDCRL